MSQQDEHGRQIKSKMLEVLRATFYFSGEAWSNGWEVTRHGERWTAQGGACTAGIIPVLLREAPTVLPPCEQKQARRVEWN